MEVTQKEDDVIAAEIKIEVTPNNWDELQELIRKIRETCKSDYKMKIQVEGNFFKTAQKDTTPNPKKEFLEEMFNEVFKVYTAPLTKLGKSSLDEV